MDMLALTELDVSGRNIRSLAGLEWALNLHTLRAGDNLLTDIGPLMENVRTGGLAGGSTIDLTGNELDLAEGSQTMTDIESLRGRGVTVHYGPRNSPRNRE